MRIATLLLALAGCSGLLGIDDLSGPGDGGPDLPSSITIRGALFQFATTDPQPLANHPISLVQMPERVHLTDAMTGADGTFALTASTNEPLDAHLEFAANPALDYPPGAAHFAGPLTADLQHDLQFNTRGNLATGAQQANDPIQGTTATLRILVARSDATPVEGVALTISPAAKIVYLSATGSIDPALTRTSSRGVAFVFNAQVGTATIAGQLGASPIAPRSIPIFAARESHYLTLTP